MTLATSDVPCDVPCGIRRSSRRGVSRARANIEIRATSRLAERRHSPCLGRYQGDSVIENIPYRRVLGFIATLACRLS